MKVVFVNGVHPDEKIGGAEYQSWLLSKALAGRHEVSFLAIRCDVGSDTDDMVDGVRVIKLAKKKKYSVKEYRGIYNHIKRLSPDIIHLRIFSHIYFFMLISKRLSVPVVYHISSLDNCRPFRRGRFRQILGQLRHFVNFRLMRRLSGVICQTDDQRNILGMSNEDIAVVRNCSDGGWQASTEKDDHLVLWVGNIKSLKRPLTFLEIAENLRDSKFRFVMVGYPQDKKLAQSVREKVAELKNVEYVPGVPVNEIDRYFKNARILVSTSAVEGYPNTFIQAIRSSTAIVSLKLDPDSILTRYQVGICVTDKQELAISVAELLNNKSRLDEMRRNMKRCLDENFQTDRNARKLEKYLQKINDRYRVSCSRIISS